MFSHNNYPVLEFRHFKCQFVLFMLLSDVKKSVITSYCHESDEEKVSISCFNNGLFLEGFV